LMTQKKKRGVDLPPVGKKIHPPRGERFYFLKFAGGM